ncbi:MAG: hypothetical protein KDA42_13655 [Planctomycetales bacterium]|nr:hypothetical protein [Planctomycetales bacterium]
MGRHAPSVEPLVRLELPTMYRFGASLLLVAACIGCQTDRKYELMQRELRLQEDRIYQLEGYIEQYQVMLEAYETEPEKIDRPEADRKPATQLPSIRQRRSRIAPSETPIPNDSLTPPSIDLGEPNSIVPGAEPPPSEDLFPQDTVPPLPDFESARSPLPARRGFYERPLLKSAMRPLERLRKRVDAGPIWQPDRGDKTPAAANLAPRWDAANAGPSAENAAAVSDRAEDALRQNERPAWSPNR